MQGARERKKNEKTGCVKEAECKCTYICNVLPWRWKWQVLRANCTKETPMNTANLRLRLLWKFKTIFVWTQSACFFNWVWIWFSTFWSSNWQKNPWETGIKSKDFQSKKAASWGRYSAPAKINIRELKRSTGKWLMNCLPTKEQAKEEDRKGTWRFEKLFPLALPSVCPKPTFFYLHG